MDQQKILLRVDCNQYQQIINMLPSPSSSCDHNNWKNIQKVNHTDEWKLYCEICDKFNPHKTLKSFQFQKINHIIAKVQKQFQQFICQMVKTFTSYKNVVFTALSKMKILSQNTNTKVNLIEEQIKAVQISCQNVGNLMFEKINHSLNKVIANRSPINGYQSSNTEIGQRNMTTSYVLGNSSAVLRMAKPKIKIQENSFQKCPISYPDARFR